MSLTCPALTCPALTGQTVRMATDTPGPDTSALDAAKYVALTTFRRNGDAVVSPVWTVRHGDGWACTTGSDSGKVKRLRHTARVELAPCDMRGAVAADAPRFSGTARVVVDPSEYATIRKAVAKKYGLMSALLTAWSKVAGLFGSKAAEGAVAWTAEGPA